MIDDPRLQELLDAYFDRRLDPASQEELERELLTRQEAREAFWEIARLEERLRRHAGEAWGMEMAAARSRRPRGIRVGLALAGLAAALVAAFAFLHDRSGPTPPAAVVHPPAAEVVALRLGGDATLGADTRAEIEAAAYEVAAGSRLKIGADAAIFQLLGGARLIVAAGAELTLISGDTAALHEGAIELQAPGTGLPVTLILPGGQVQQSDGLLAAKIDRSGRSTGLQVVHGSARLRHGTAAWQQLAEGSVGVLHATGWQAGEPSVGSDGTDLSDRVDQDRAASFARWRDSSRIWSQDPAMLIHLRLQDEGAAPKDVANDARHAAAASLGAVIGARWSEGRWPGKRALAFHNAADRVLVRADGSYPQVSMAAWVVVDELRRPFNGLFFTEWGKPGEIHWQLAADSGFRFGLRPEKSLESGEFLRAFSDPLPKETRGRWIFLATTYDAPAARVRHYVNGREITSVTLASSPPAVIGAATIGNCASPPPDPWGPRPFGGLIDEFMLLHRLLSPEEIRRIHQEGMPR